MKRRASLAVGLVLASALAGCSGKSESESTTPAATRPAVADHIDVVATDFGFSDPAWTIAAGEDVSVHFANHGTLEHEWAVLREGRDIGRQRDFTEDRVLLEVEAIAWDHDADQTIRIDEPGTYQVICALQGHFDAGMHATLYVEA